MCEADRNPVMATTTPSSHCYLGIDAGGEMVRAAVLEQEPSRPARVVWLGTRAHDAKVRETVLELLAPIRSHRFDCIGVTGRLAELIATPRVPVKQAQTEGFRLLFPDLEEATVVSIGSRRFSVLEIESRQHSVMRFGPRCSQGTGNFLTQLVERFGLTVAQAAEQTALVEDPEELSNRCPVILKTDMTHLANRGGDQLRILAGAFDAVSCSVESLIRPEHCPPAVVLAGGLSRAPRIRSHVDRFLRRHGMWLLPHDESSSLYLEAIGCAVVARNGFGAARVTVEELLGDRRGGRPTSRTKGCTARPPSPSAQRLPPLGDYLHLVRRLPTSIASLDGARTAILGLDIGSTGAKAAVIDADGAKRLWECYLPTRSDPVAAVRQLVARLVAADPGGLRVDAIGVTGSGRDIVGSLMATCFGEERVLVLNEIVAHAQGAVFFDPTVDTIFEIGGQDAKFIRLFRGQVVDAAMNEACSAGTGSFIEEQGCRIAGVRTIEDMSRLALAAGEGVSLGQHCSVFMAELIDGAVAAGEKTEAVVSGLFDAVIRNYLHRVRGARTIGSRIFCQGMPFCSDALAAAVVRHLEREVRVPPNPGTVGALGIALLARQGRGGVSSQGLALGRFLESRILDRKGFVCRSRAGCSGDGNRCRIERMSVQVADRQESFFWGGACSLYHSQAAGRSLPDNAPDPFQQRASLIGDLIDECASAHGPTVGMSSELVLAELLPFFLVLFRGMGFAPVVQREAGRDELKQGREGASVPFCAPMQLLHGVARGLASSRLDLIFLPVLQSLPPVNGAGYSTVCPLVQGSSDIIRWDLGLETASTVSSPVINFGPGGLDSEPFRASCSSLGRRLGVAKEVWRTAFKAACEAQKRFEAECERIGSDALRSCASHGVDAVVVLGRPYVIHNPLLTSNVVSLLRAQGAVAIPMDCFPVDEHVPGFGQLYWGYAQRILRAAYALRRQSDLHAVYCSTYSCGPDSFILHLFTATMGGRPYAVVETDAHAADAGIKTRIEAFLHCARTRLDPDGRTASQWPVIASRCDRLGDIRRDGRTLLIPRMSPAAEILAASFRGAGFRAESLPMPDREAIQMGRRHTSGKECAPAVLTLGSLLQRLAHGNGEGFSFFMPTARGPCRFGMYNVLHKLILERLGLAERVGVFSPAAADYFAEVPPAFQALVWAGFVASDLLLAALHHNRPSERQTGAAQSIYDRFAAQLAALAQERGAGDLSWRAGCAETLTGTIFGIRALLERAAAAFIESCDPEPELPTVALVGEIYMRCDPAANGFLAEWLGTQGIRVRLAPFGEWIEYTDLLSRSENRGPRRGLVVALSTTMRRHIQAVAYQAMAPALGRRPRSSVEQQLAAAEPYLCPALRGEAVLTIGGPAHEHEMGLVDGVINVGPVECMPTKLAESQLNHLCRRTGLVSMTLELDGEAVDQERLDSFVFDLLERHRRRLRGRRQQCSEVIL
jgi:predicted CoA-substrate-specific enzyme activase